jgi:membrane dipeptidase
VDLSHAGERSFFETIEVSTKPVIASHSGCRALHDHPRNLTDEQLLALRDNGGVLGVVFHPGFLCAKARSEEERVRSTDGYKALSGTNDSALFLSQSDYLRTHAEPFDVQGLVDHIVHAVEVAGIDHVGLGSDYDGIQRGPAGLEDASCYGYLAELLLGQGFSAGEVGQVLGGNMVRAFEQATLP